MDIPEDRKMAMAKRLATMRILNSISEDLITDVCDVVDSTTMRLGHKAGDINLFPVDRAEVLAFNKSLPSFRTPANAIMGIEARTQYTNKDGKKITTDERGLPMISETTSIACLFVVDVACDNQVYDLSGMM